MGLCVQSYSIMGHHRPTTYEAQSFRQCVVMVYALVEAWDSNCKHSEAPEWKNPVPHFAVFLFLFCLWYGGMPIIAEILFQAIRCTD